MLEVRYCAWCQVEAVFEQPPCDDGHDADCPEWICTACGFAVVVGPGPVLEAADAAAGRRPAAA